MIKRKRWMKKKMLTPNMRDKAPLNPTVRKGKARAKLEPKGAKAVKEVAGTAGKSFLSRLTWTSIYRK